MTWLNIGADPYYYTRSEIIYLHNRIHLEYGDATPISQEVIEAEQLLSSHLRYYGIEHRHQDKLAKKAATYREKLLPFTLQELWAYTEQAIILESAAVQFVTKEKNGRIYVIFKGVDGREDAILRAVNRNLPPGVSKLTRLNGTAKADFLYLHPAYQLVLQEADRYGETVTTWEALNLTIQKAAAEASVIFKSDVSIPFNVVKGSLTEERIVTSVVLEPETPDNTKTEESQGDIYSEEVIQKGMYWWMENAGQSFSYQHTMPETRDPSPWAPGRPLTSKDIKLLENWQTRVPQTIGTQNIQKGTWMTTARILNDDLWREIKEGRITAWSVGMEAMGKVETYQVVEGH
jgi:hypothetical protein